MSNRCFFLWVVCALLFIVCGRPLVASTWYVRPDGGTRYSDQAKSGQCNGKADAAYPGHGTNQACAFKDVRDLWTDGIYCTDNSTKSKCWKWIGSGGDTYLIRGALADHVSYRVGQNGPNPNDYLGLAGNPYGAGAPPPPSGSAAQHTRILGGNFASCSAQNARTQLHGGYGVGAVLNLSGASYVDVACLDITDFSSCGRSGQSHGCNTNYPLSDYAGTGIQWSTTSTHDKLTDIRIHGLAATGMLGPTGDDVTMKDIAIIGNAGAGWNADDGSGTTGTGTLLVQDYEISWNGCSEEYPLVDGLPYQDCSDDNSGGYGDGFGTATVPSNPGWKVHFDHGLVSYNTQDGLDALHIGGGGSSMTVTNTLAFGNMGQQIKVGGAVATMQGNQIFTNCNALREKIPGTPAGYNTRLSDFCRAADSGVVFTVNDGSVTTFSDNLLYSASATGVEVDVSSKCETGSCLIKQQRNIFLGFRNNAANGYPNGGTGELSNPFYVDKAAVKAYLNQGSTFDHNTTFHAKANWKCPAKWLHETDANCDDPHLPDESWHNYGHAQVKASEMQKAVAHTPKPGGSRSANVKWASMGFVLLAAVGLVKLRKS